MRETVQLQLPLRLIAFRLPDDLLCRIRIAAKQADCSVSELLRIAAVAHLAASAPHVAKRDRRVA
jgi:hypothetical protein